MRSGDFSHKSSAMGKKIAREEVWERASERDETFNVNLSELQSSPQQKSP